MTIVVSLGELLTRTELALRPVVDLRRDDPVRWVATSDLADPSPYLEGGEVLLTTGLNTVGWAQEWEEYVRRLAEVGVLALGLGTELTHARSPEALRDACVRHGLALFEVPKPTRFVAISHAVAALLRDEEESVARRIVAAQRPLMQAALQEHEPMVLLESVARIGIAAAVVNVDGEVLLGPCGDQPELLRGEEFSDAVRDEIRRMRARGLRAAATIADGRTQVLVQPLGVRGRPNRYLVSGFAGHASPVQRSTLGTALALLSLAEERRRAGSEAQREMRSRAVELLVNGDVHTARVVLNASGDAWLLPNPDARLRMVRAAGPAERLDDAMDLLEASRELAGRLGAEIVAVVRVSRTVRLVEGLAAGGLRVGVGDAVALTELGVSHANAGHALARTSAQARRVWWDETVRSGVLAVLDTERGAAYGASYLGPLSAQGSELVGTLEAYLRHNGSLHKAADELGIHRNTLRSRVERIEKALGQSLLSPQTRADAWIALHAGRPASMP